MYDLLIFIYKLINQNIILLLFFVSFLGLTVFITHGFHNRYLLKQNMIALSVLLPPIALVITKAISSNFFLSLGMIGALSIIRYRNPVKSGYELALLFGLVTIGVVGGVDLKLCVTLSIFIILVVPILHFARKIFPNLILSESSVVSGVQLIVTFKNFELNEDFLNLNNKKLKNFSTHDQQKDKIFIYSFSFNNMEDAINFKTLLNSINNNNEIKLIST